MRNSRRRSDPHGRDTGTGWTGRWNEHLYGRVSVPIERLILGFHVVPDCWLLQGGTTGGGGVMRWLEREFGAYEREEGKRQGKSSLDLA